MKHGKFIVSLLVAILLVSCAPIKPFQDIRDKDVKNHGNLGEVLIQTLWFNESTIWTEKDKALVENIMKLGMDPGLGIRALHSEGITGQGVNVAIIDQNMVLDHPEVRGKIVKYFDAGTKTAANEGSMHGPAVTSLLVGENIGTAPEANVYYAAAPSWTGDAQYYADALKCKSDQSSSLH